MLDELKDTLKSNNGNPIAYTYDAIGNIKTIVQNGKTITYTYNELNEVTREDNQTLNKTIIYTYDAGGNITNKVQYPYNTGTLAAAISTINYGYGDSNWKDKLTSYNGKAITYDAIGNPLSDGTFNYTWEEGRQLSGISGNGQTISYKYNDSGIRTQKTVNGVATNYRLEGDKVTYEDNGTNKIYYTYDSAGSLLSMNLNGAEYYYVKNAQGDIIGLFDSTGTQVVSYTYDMWGKLVSTSGSLASTVGVANPYRYKGYRYDSETGLYYLQSRYYNPDWGRFINADGLVADDSDLLASNMFAYCDNNPIILSDIDGCRPDISGTGHDTGDDLELSLSYMSNVNKQNYMNSIVSKKEAPPAEVGYVAPKGNGSTKTAKAPNGQKGFQDSKGNVWVPIPEGHPLAHGGEHWDVNYPNGGYDNVYPNGHVRKGSGSRGMFSPEGKRIVTDTAISGGEIVFLYGAYRVVRMIPSLAPPLWWTIPENIACP